MELVELNELRQVLEDFAKDIRERYRDVLMQNDHVASHDLVNSVTTRVDMNGSAFEVIMTLKDYWKYVEEDTRPHFPPPSAILRWIEIKPVIPRPDAYGRIPTPKQLSYLIARKISIEGTKGTHDLAQTKDDILTWYRDRISQALGHDMEAYIRKIVVEK